jgi:DNA invertase Pin-like site-specific DNA recombinase
MLGRKPLFTREQAAEIARRYELFMDNRPGRIAREYGVEISTVRRYGKRGIKHYTRP